MRVHLTHHTDQTRTIVLRALLLFALIAGLSARLYLSTWPSNFDMDNYFLDGQIMLSGGNIYALQPYYNYSPVWAWITYFAARAGGDFHFNLHLFLIAADLLAACCVGLMAERYYKLGALAFMSYWLNPAIVWLVGYWGNFDTLATLPILIAVAFSQRLKMWQVWLLLTSALLIKHITLPFVWMTMVYLYKSRGALVLMLASLAIFAVSFVPYLEAFDSMIANVARYGGSTTAYGFSQFLPRQMVTLVFYTVIAALPIIIVRLRFDFPTAMIAAALTLFTFLYGISAPNFILTLVWAAVKPNRWLAALTAVVLHIIVFVTFQPKQIEIPLTIGWITCGTYLAVLFAFQYYKSNQPQQQMQLEESSSIL